MNGLPNIFILDDDPISSLIIKTWVEANFRNPLIVQNDPVKALESLKFKDNIGLLITDVTLGMNNEFENIVNFMRTERNEVKIIFMSGTELSKLECADLIDESSFLIKGSTQDDLTNLITKMVPEVVDTFKNFKRVHILELLTHSSSSYPVFIEIGKNKIIQVVDNEGDGYEEILKKYLDKGVDTVFLLENHYKTFLNEFMESAHLSFDSKVGDVDFKLFGTKSIHEIIQNIGVSKEVLDLTDKLTNKIEEHLTKNNNALGELLQKLKNSGSYIYSHGLLTSYISIEMCYEMDFGNENNASKLASASLLKDISLTDENLAKIQSVESSEFKSLSEDEKKLVLNHPLKSKEILEGIDDMDNDMLKLILEHQERPQGQGFPKKLLGPNISILAAIFILANQYAHLILTNHTDETSLLKIKEMINEQYSTGNFRKAKDLFIKILEKAN